MHYHDQVMITAIPMHAGDEGIAALEEVLCTTKAMTSLVLAHTELTEHSGPVLGRLVEFVPKLAHLDVSWNQLGPLTAEALAGGLVPGGHLVSLDVSWNGLEAGAGLIAAALQKGGGAPLRMLNLSGTRPSDEVTIPPPPPLPISPDMIQLCISTIRMCTMCIIGIPDMLYMSLISAVAALADALI